MGWPTGSRKLRLLINAFSTVQFNKNDAMAKHLDSLNIGPSYTIGLGGYDGW